MNIKCPKWLQKNDIVEEKDLINKSLDELILLKDEEHDFLSINIPILAAIWIALLPMKNSWNWRILFCYYLARAVMSFYVIEVNEIAKKNMKTYNKVISRKMKEQKDKDEVYKKLISNYLQKIGEK